MALVSPGVEVTVIDESQYIPSAVNTVPYFLIATAQNKVSSDGVTVAAGTLAANANKTYLITSQRDLAATFGVPFFYQTTTGTAINGYELNEYGLLAAYSSLGITNRCYVQRANIDLAELTASLSRPTGSPTNGDFWLDTSTSVWGIQEWNATTNTFTVKTPIVITDSADIVTASAPATPIQSIGSIGDYAVTNGPDANGLGMYLYGWYKNSSNDWTQIGSDDWKNSWPTVQGTLTFTTAPTSTSFRINDQLIVITSGDTLANIVTNINSYSATTLLGVTAAAVSSKLTLYADSEATNDGSTGDGGIVTIDLGTDPTTSAALLALFGISTGEYYAPQYFPSYSYQTPRWAVGQTSTVVGPIDTTTGPRPTGSIWNNLSPSNNGLSLKVKRYSSSLGTFITQDCPSYASDNAAIYALDPTGGGANIPLGTTYAIADAAAFGDLDTAFAFQIVERVAIGQTIVTGTAAPAIPFVSGQTFSISASGVGTSTPNSATATLSGTTVDAFISAVSSANVPYVSASVNSAGQIVFTHSKGGSITIANTGGGVAITTAGFTLGTNAIPGTDNTRRASRTANGITLTYFLSAPTFTYTASSTTPDQDPADGRLWYYSTVSDVDILIQNNNGWFGYQNVTNDVRGFNLGNTDPNGPQVAATAPTEQSDGTALVWGDLWVDSSDLENYPLLYRWEPVSGVDQWVAVDTADQVTQNGILFADTRWAGNGTTDPVMDPFPTIKSLLVSDYTDLDAPDPALYPQGMLLFNTRRSGYNVKSFQSDYFNANSYPDDTLPVVTSTWLTASGNKDDGSMWAGRQAQRQLIVQAMKSGIDTSQAAREEQNQFSLIAATAYPELIPNMVALSNERNNTLFVVGDTPMRLPATGTELTAWSTNNGGLGFPTEDGLVTASQYLGTFYPSCQTTDLSGNTVVTAPSHMMMRTIIRSDAVSYPWLAPAGTRRGVVDNALAIGYIDAATGEFQQLNMGQGVRDVLYEADINPITFIPGVGIVNFGNKTTTSITSALDRINVSRLIAFLRGRLEEIGKLYLFEPNDDITRAEITNTVNSLMIDLVAKRGIYDYLVVCDLSNNTPARIDRNELWLDIAIEPVKAVEFIYIPLRIKNTGEISGQAS